MNEWRGPERPILIENAWAYKAMIEVRAAVTGGSRGPVGAPDNGRTFLKKVRKLLAETARRAKDDFFLEDSFGDDTAELITQWDEYNRLMDKSNGEANSVKQSGGSKDSLIATREKCYAAGSAFGKAMAGGEDGAREVERIKKL